MSEWTEYTGSDEQIADLESAEHGFIYRNANGLEFSKNTDVSGLLYMSEYLICNPHPLAVMICQQSQTGQPVWVRRKIENEYFYWLPTTTPDWNIPSAEYSFRTFED